MTLPAEKVSGSMRCGTAAALLCLLSGAFADSGSAPSKTLESPLSATNLMETGLGLAAVLAVMLGLAWVVKRFVQVPGLGRGQVQVLGGVSLGARERAVLLSVEGRRVLVGVAPGQVRTLMALEDDPSQTSETFEAQLSAVSAKQRHGEVGS